MAGANGIQALRRQAWALGRGTGNDLVAAYQREYGVEVPPPPAKIAGDLLTDILQVTLRYDPLPEDRFAQTEWFDGRAVVTINSLTDQIPGVKDAEGIQNVAKLHELIHVVRDLHVLRAERGNPLPGFDVPLRIACRRHGKAKYDPADIHREFWAEEAGRAAAVSHRALSRSDAFRALMKLPCGSVRANAEAWRLLYEAAGDISVNSTALVTQLRAEGLIGVTKEGGRSILHVQPSLADWIAAV